MATFHLGFLYSAIDTNGRKKKKEEIKCNASKKGSFPVYLTITHNRKLARYKTSVELESMDCWNPKEEEVRKSCPDYKIYNERLKRVLERAKDAEIKLIESGAEITSKSIIETFKKMEANTIDQFSFLEFAESYCKQVYELGNYRTYQKYNTLLGRLKCFINGIKPKDSVIIRRTECQAMQKKFVKDLRYKEITLSFLNDFKAYLQKCPSSCNSRVFLNPNTIKKYMLSFSAIYMKGLNRYEEEGLKVSVNPFLKFECKGIEASEKSKLTEEEIQSIMDLDLKKDSLIWHSRNCFLMAFYCGGMRFGDAIQIRQCNIVYEDGYRLKYTMEKTDKIKNIILVSEAVEILKMYMDLEKPSKAYIFPFLKEKSSYGKAVTPAEKASLNPSAMMDLKKAVSSKNALINKKLGEIAELAGINKHISTHIARHSFADLARRKSENLYDIKSVLGHTSIKTTQSYLTKLDTDTQDKALQNVFHKEEKEDKAEAILKQLESIDKDTLKAVLERLTL